MTFLTEQQAQAVFSVDKNVLVSAGAGSGKTHVLVERYVEILRNDPSLTVDGIIAVTFTRKAAGEMRTRLKGRFRQLTELESESDRWRQCLADIDSARIGTIHSLCESILKAFPSEAGIDPQFEVIDEVSQAQLLEESIDQTFREVIGDSLPEIKLLGEHSIEEVRNWLKQMLAASLQFEESSKNLLNLEDHDLLFRFNETRHRIQLRMLRDTISKPDWQQAYSYLAETFARDRLEQLRANIVDAADEIFQCSYRSELSHDDSSNMWSLLSIMAGADLRLGGHSDEAKAIKERIGVLKAIARKLMGKPQLPSSITDQDLEKFVDERHLSDYFYRSQRIYSERKKAELRLDYNDLISLAYATLSREESSAREHYQEKIKAILVDEFQDTNTIQADLISFLAGPKARLFLIGDDKQSIYKFQGADVSTFNMWKERLASGADSRRLSGPSVVTKLTVSFRSHPKVVAFVNSIFSRLMSKDSSDVQYRATFEPLSTFRKTLQSAVPVETGTSSVGATVIAVPAGAAAEGGIVTLSASSFAIVDQVEKIAGKASLEQKVAQVVPLAEPRQLNIFDLAGAQIQATETEMEEFAPPPPESFAPPPDDSIRMESRTDLDQESIESVPEVANIQVVVFDAHNEDGDRQPELSALTESRTVAKWIDDLVRNGAPLLDNEGNVQRGLTYGDFAILVPKNSNFQIIERGLLERSIPYVTFAGRGFLNRQEVIDFENLLYFLGNQQDSHALLGALRSPMFALSDDMLHEIFVSASSEKPGITLWDALQSTVLTRRSGYETVLKVVNLLKRFKEDAERLSLTALIRKLIQTTSYDLALMSADNGRQRSRNLWKLVALARDHEDLSFFEFAKRLTLMRDFELKQTDAPFSSHDSVKLMTIHASKGLEFPAIALPCLSGRLLGQERKLIFHRNYGFALDTSRGEPDSRPTWFRYARQLDQDMEIAERKRLLYVAMTRSRDYLGVFLEKDTGQQQDSFRLWLSDILDVDFHGDDGRTGPRYLVRESGMAEYELFTVDREAVEPESELLSGKDVDEEEVKSITNLIEPILPDPVSPSSPWQGWRRVTPTRDGVHQPLDATVIGVYLHTILEHLPMSLERPSRQILESLALMQGSSVAHPDRLRELINEGEKLLDVFFESSLYELLKGARRRLSELPYTIVDETRSDSRRPDLVVECDDGEWLIIDYKTDDVHQDDLQSKARTHAAQLDGYARDLGKLTGLRLSTRLYFARYGKLVDPHL